MKDQKGATILVPLLPPVPALVADRGDDRNPFRTALAERGITACIPPKKNRKQPIPHDKATASRAPSPASTTDAASPPATIGAPPSSSGPSPSPPSSSSGSGNVS
jgi:hypothetical protein